MTFSLISLQLIDFDVDGFGFFYTTKHAQIVTGCPPFSTQTLFAAHIYTFFLKGVSSISKEGVEFNTMRASGTVSVYKEIRPYYLLCPYLFKFIIGNLDLITLYKHSK